MTSDRPLDLRRVRVVSTGRPAIDVTAFELEAIDGRPLRPFTPGAHIDVQVPGGPTRQYSLCGDPAAASGRYTIAVRKETTGRGGSIGMHERVDVGSVLSIGGPRNNFPLAPGRHPNLFIAGGIGITPITAMVNALHAEGQDWALHYCARSARHAAFYPELAALAPARVHGCFSERPILDVAALLCAQADGTHVYCCGPKGLMNAVAEAAAGWPTDRVHFEWFTPPDLETGPNIAFAVELKRSGAVLTVPADQSILEVLRDHGFEVASSCEEGICGTCETRVLDGEPEHRDALLSPAERAANTSMMICVSRAKSPRLVLDL